MTRPTRPQRLSEPDKHRVRAEHRIVDVLARLGIDPPTGRNGASDFKISCPCPGHRDSTPSCIVHVGTDRWHCFGCSHGGDVLELVRQVEGITSLALAAAALDSRRPLVPVASVEPSNRPPATVVASVERPDPDRTSMDRVLAANAVAWRHLTSPALAARGRAYLTGRGIDVTAIEAETGRPVVGHTPYAPDALVSVLRRHRFIDDEIVDAGWASRTPDGQLRDRFRRRALIPVRDERGRLLGVYGRDVTGRASSKYLNTAETIAFHKGSAVYRPSTPDLDRRATLIVCEGSLDALAIAAAAASIGTSACFAPVSPSGTALTDRQVRLVLAAHPTPPLVCADGDAAGVAASVAWADKITRAGRESVVTVLRDGHDPASWLREHGPAGLTAFTRKGCLSHDPGDVRPAPAASLLATSLMDDAIAASAGDAMRALPSVLATLGRYGAIVPGEAAAGRFAAAAGRALAAYEVGTDSALSRRVLVAVRAAHQPTERTSLCPAPSAHAPQL